MNGNSIRTFLGANTPKGFFSYYEPFTENKKAYIVKGGPGTGKSGLMKKIASEAVGNGYFTEYVYCSSDPVSLDGVHIPELNTVIADGTPPHTLEPPIPGALGGIINLSEFWNEKQLQNAIDEIKELRNKISKCFSKCYHYLNAAGSIRADISGNTIQYLQVEKATKFLKNFCAKLIPKQQKKTESLIQKRFISSITPNGLISFNDTVYTLCDKVFTLKDDYFISSFFIKYIVNEVVENGYDCFVFYDPLSPYEPIHIAIPALDFAVVTSTQKTPFEPNKTKRIYLKRFFNEDIYFNVKRLAFAKKVFNLCIDEACLALKTEKALHDDLEEIYISAMDFEKVNKITKKYSDIILK